MLLPLKYLQKKLYLKKKLNYQTKNSGSFVRNSQEAFKKHNRRTYNRYLKKQGRPSFSWEIFSSFAPMLLQKLDMRNKLIS